jgi:hypothetical protein
MGCRERFKRRERGEAKNASRPVRADFLAESNKKRVKVFAFIHPQITGKSTTPYAQIPTLTPDEFLDHALSVPNPLLSALFGLATDQKVSKKSWPDYQSQLLAIAAAKDSMLRSIVQHPCHFQLMVNDLLEMEDLTQLFRLQNRKNFKITHLDFKRSHTICMLIVRSLLVHYSSCR